MSRRLLSIILFAGFVLCFAPLARGEDDEPTVNSKKLSYWLTLLESSKDEKDRRRSVTALELIGHYGSRKVTPALLKAAREDKEAVVRARAIRALGRTTAKALEKAREEKKDELPRTDQIRDTLITALRTEKDEAVREAAALALGDLGTEARGAVGTLATALKDKHPGTVKAAVQTLRRLGRDAREAQMELQGLLQDKSADLEARIDAAYCLGQIRPDVTQALPVLRPMLLDEKLDPQLRKTVVEAVGKLGKEGADAAAHLGTILSGADTTPDLRLAAAAALDQIGPDAKAAIPALIQSIGDPKLIKSMGDSARFIRCLSMHALGRMGKELQQDRKAAVEAILRATDDVNVEVCVTAWETLGAIGRANLGSELEAVNNKLETTLLREGRKSVREAVQATKDKLNPTK